MTDDAFHTDRCVTIHYVSGLDWSGDAGTMANAVRSSPYLVVGMCHTHTTNRQRMSDAVAHLREELHLPIQHTFKFAKSSDRTRDRFLEVLMNLDISFTAAAVDRRLWTPAYVQGTSGSQRIVDAICVAAEALPDDLICGQQRARGKIGFSKIAPLPDDRGDALIIQAADFIAGYVGRTLVQEAHPDDRLARKLTMLRV